MSAFVEAWPCVVGNVGPTEQLAGMGTLLAAAYPPASVNGRLDQMWPWSAGHGVGTQAAPTTHAGVGLHSQAGNTPPPTTTDSRSTSPLQHQSPDFHQDDDLRPPSPLQHTKGPSEPESKGKPKNQKPRRKMQDHPGSRKKQPAAAAQAALPSSSSSSQDASNVKPKKRGRKPKNPLPEPTVTPPQQHDEFEDDDDFDDDHLEFDDIDEEDLPRDPRRRRTLERNRIAARKCRVRKRDEASALASREQAVEDQNRYLSTTYNSLTTEVYLLKTELLRHTHCNCKLIQEYIANEARRSVDKMNASPSSSQSHHLSTPTNLHNQTRRSSYFETEPGSFDGHSTLTEPVKNTWNNGFVPVDGTATPFQHVCNHQHSHQPVAQDGPHHDGSFGHIHHGHYGQPQCGVPGQFHDVAHGQMDTNVNMAGFNEQLNGQGFGPFFGSQTNFGPSFTKEQ